MKPLRAELIENERSATEALLVRLIRYPEERSLVAAVLSPEEISQELVLHRRLFSLVMSAPGGELDPMALRLYEVLISRNDEETSDLLAGLGCTPHEPCCLSETLQLAVFLHDQAYDCWQREAEKAFEEAWAESAPIEIPVQSEDDCEEW